MQIGFPRNAKIKLGRGDIKNADQIRPGDLLQTTNGHMVTVDNVYTSTSEFIMVIITQDDTVLRISKGHPLCTNLRENTFRPASELKPGDKLIAEDGSEKTIRDITPVPNDRDGKLYYFDIAEFPGTGCPILCDGIWSK